MNLKTKIILSAALVALLSAPASARFDGDEGGLSAHARFTSKERVHTQMGHLVNRPFVR
jgi:hypothetical protein